jgi:hypothetical protein
MTVATLNAAHPPPDLPSADGSKPSTGGYSLYHLIAVLDRRNCQPTLVEIKAEPEDDRHWMRQAPGRPDFS